MSYFTLSPSALHVQIQRNLNRTVVPTLYTPNFTNRTFKRDELTFMHHTPNYNRHTVYVGTKEMETWLDCKDACGNVVQIDTDGDMLTFYTTETSNETLHLKSDIIDY